MNINYKISTIKSDYYNRFNNFDSFEKLRSDPAPKAGAKDAGNVVNADDGYAKTKWRQECIWVEAIEKEAKTIKEWESNWSFLAEYDQYGNLKSKKPLPTKVNMFSETLPSSSGHTYGNRLNTSEAQQISSIENAISSSFRKRRNTALICYD